MSQLKAVINILGGRLSGLYILVPLYFLASILELFGLGMLLVFANFLTSTETIWTVPIVGIVLEKNYQLALLGSFSIFLFFIFRSIVSVLVHKQMLAITFHLGAALRLDLLIDFFKWDFESYRHSSKAELVQKNFVIVGKFISHFIQPVVRLLSEAITISFLVLALGFLEPILLSLLCIILVFLGLGFDAFSKSKLKNQGVKENKISTEVINVLNDSFTGWKFLTLAKKDDYFVNLFNQKLNKLIKVRISNQILLFSIRLFIEISIVFFIFISIVTAYFTTTTFQDVVASLVIFVVASLKLVPSVSTIITNIGKVRNSRDAVFRLLEIKTKAANNRSNEHTTDEKIYPFTSLSLRGLEITNRDSKSTVSLPNLTITKGDMIGLAGPSGSGKTTILNFLSGLIPASKGSVTINGSQSVIQHELSERLKTWSIQLEQEHFVFAGSIYQNVMLTDQYSEEMEEKSWRSLTLAGATQYVSQLDNGINHMILDAGGNLSGGQKQRLSIARVLATDKNIILLDEPTSALDEALATSFIKSLKRYKENQTFIISTHDTSILQYCDKTLEFDENTNSFILRKS